jgi:hypothetical protein
LQRGVGGISEDIFQIGFSKENFKILHVSSTEFLWIASILCTNTNALTPLTLIRSLLPSRERARVRGIKVE